MIIVPASAHLEYFTHPLNRKSGAVMGYKPVNLPSPLEKMLMAFLGCPFPAPHPAVVSLDKLPQPFEQYV
jgi:hypothetical protein